jgi:hypothetical protein
MDSDDVTYYHGQANTPQSFLYFYNWYWTVVGLYNNSIFYITIIFVYNQSTLCTYNLETIIVFFQSLQ